MKYKLYLGDTKPAWWKPGDPLIYDLEDGRFDCDYDLVTENLPESITERIYECLSCLYCEHDKKYYNQQFKNSTVADDRLKKPIGLNARDAEYKGFKIVLDK